MGNTCSVPEESHSASEEPELRLKSPDEKMQLELPIGKTLLEKQAEEPKEEASQQKTSRAAAEDKFRKAFAQKARVAALCRHGHTKYMERHDELNTFIQQTRAMYAEDQAKMEGVMLAMQGDFSKVSKEAALKMQMSGQIKAFAQRKLEQGKKIQEVRDQLIASSDKAQYISDIVRVLDECENVHLFSAPYQKANKAMLEVTATLVKSPAVFMGQEKLYALKRDCSKMATKEERSAAGKEDLQAIYDLVTEAIRGRTFVFNPDIHMETLAQAHDMTPEEQGRRWLQIWVDFCLFAQECKKNGYVGQVHVMIPSGKPMPKPNALGQYDLEDIDSILVGGAQHGEVRIAYGFGFTSEDTGLIFHQF